MPFTDRILEGLAAAGPVAPLAIFLIVFAESGLLLFIPGETVVVAGAALAASGQFPLVQVGLAAIAGAWLGDSTGYLLGRGPGRRRFIATGRFLLLRQAHVARVERLLERWGIPAVLGARFLPVARVAGPFVFGLVGLPPSRFFPVVAASGLIWGCLFCALGYLLGNVWAQIHVWFGRAALVGFAALAILAAWLWWRRRRRKATDLLNG